MAFAMKYAVIARYLTAPSQRRSGTRANQIRFIVAHDTGNPNATAAANVRYYESSRNDLSASAHLFVDDREIIECIPALTGTPEKAWHVRYDVTGDNARYGADANDAAIGVELCFSDNGSINNEEAYRRYVWLLAFICYRFGLNPATAIIGHETLDPSRRDDPSNALRRTGRNFQTLINDVVKEYNSSVGGTATAPPATAPTPAPAGSIGVATILADTLNVRSAPSINAPVVSTVSRDGRYIVFAEQNGWYNVGTNQFISANPAYVSFAPATPAPAAAPATPAPAAAPSTPPAGVAPGVGTATILASSLNVRSGPGIDFPIVKTVSQGDRYRVFYEQNGWYNVGGNQFISASATFVRFTADAAGIGVATILATALNVRSGPSINAPVVKTVNQGERYVVFYEQDGWYNVGTNQFISASPSYVRFQSN
ncbi:SH3 domain-containing protein [Ectobacillus ponti]|uniref:Autolysin n=1 Tax=Ectobacillus ponti TaxID=2961894 RepID=A0AA41X8S0_9BACI|nr:SH3 domain-containing protein [Ectobacillus ponti]MCP8970994.1 SH3 domain-containing protein [Ectobacillus ponti]